MHVCDDVLCMHVVYLCVMMCMHVVDLCDDDVHVCGDVHACVDLWCNACVMM